MPTRKDASAPKQDGDRHPSPSADNATPTSQSTFRTSLVSAEPELKAALRLVADSVGEARLIAFRCVVFHPLVSTPLVLSLSLLAQRLYTGRWSDIVLVLFSAFAVVAMCGLIVLNMTSEYSWEAERVYSSLMGQVQRHVLSKFRRTRSAHKEPQPYQVLVVKDEDDEEEVIGALVLHFLPDEKAEILAWSIEPRHRGKGLGTSLLFVAVDLCKEHDVDMDQIAFSPEHANAYHPLPRMFNKTFLKRQQWAEKKLQTVLQDSKEGKTPVSFWESPSTVIGKHEEPVSLNG